MSMNWRDHMLRWLARGPRTADGEPLKVEVTLRVLDYIDAHPEVADRLSDPRRTRCTGGIPGPLYGRGFSRTEM